MGQDQDELEIAKYLGHRIFLSKVIVRTYTYRQTDTHR